MALQPKVISATEGTAIGPNKQLIRTVILTYMVGDFGPFKLSTTQADIQSGAAMTAMTTFANSLAALPT